MNPQNINRLRVKELIALSPGIHLRKLQKLLGMSWSTTRYHVNNLMQDGEIISSTDRGYSRFYPTGTTNHMKAVYACLQSKTARKVLQGLVDEPMPGLTQINLSEKIHLSRSTVNGCVTLLYQLHLVRRSFTVDGQVVFGIKDRNHVLELLAVFKKNNLLNVASDRFTDLWDL